MQPRAINFIVGTLSLLLISFLVYTNREFFHDDAFISLRYARHIVEGSGMVWNVGEHVQGYSNFLHIIITAMLGSAGIDYVLATRVIGFMAWAGIILALLVYAQRDKSILSELHYVPAILAAGASPILIWSLGGLETVLFAFLLTWACLRVADGFSGEDEISTTIFTGILFALAILTRPDGVVATATAVSFGAFSAYRSTGFRSLFIMLGVLLAILLPYLLWVQSYYGDVLPNTFYAKADGFTLQRLLIGFDYVVEFVFTPPFLPLAAVITGILCWRNGSWTLKHSFLAAVIIAHFLYVIWVGGDHMQSFRFVVPVIGVLSYLTVLSISGIVVVRQSAYLKALPVAAVLLLSLQIFSHKLNPVKMDAAAFVGRSVGLYINQYWPEGSVIALNTAGSTPYFADKNTYIDMLGLNDRHISRRKISQEDIRLPWQSVPGHSKGDGRYVLDRQPDYIIVGPAEGTVIECPWFLSDLELSEDLRFKKQYLLKRLIVTDDSAENFSFIYYQRK
jgi:arabinofuranosyltransferase